MTCNRIYQKNIFTASRNVRKAENISYLIVLHALTIVEVLVSNEITKLFLSPHTLPHNVHSITEKQKQQTEKLEELLRS